MLPQQTKSGIPFLVLGGDHSPIPGGENFSGMKRKASDISVRLTNPFPSTVPQDFAADGTSRILDQRERMFFGDGDHADQVTRHSDLVHT